MPEAITITEPETPALSPEQETDAKDEALIAESKERGSVKLAGKYESIEELKTISNQFKFDPLFEGGEGETLVIDSPLFIKKLEILDSSICKIGGYSYLKITDAVLSDKHLIESEVIS